MSGYTVHTIPVSAFGRAVLIALEEKGAPYRLVAVAPGTLRSPEHTARHPFARVPVLEHDGFRLYETQAILRYLDRVLPAPPLTPTGAHGAARMDQLMAINDWYLFQGVANVIGFQRVVGPRLLGLTPDETAIAAAMPKARTVFTELSALLGRQPFFAGEAFTLADVLLAPQFDFLSATPEWAALTADTPRLCEWLERARARPSLEATTWERVAARAAAA
ncbi:MAG: glutathione S-transferase family protein [Metallibacterium sp.]